MDMDFDTTIPIYNHQDAANADHYGDLQLNMGAYMEASNSLGSNKSDWETISTDIEVQQALFEDVNLLPIENHFYCVPDHIHMVTPPTEPVIFIQNTQALPEKSVVPDSPMFKPAPKTENKPEVKTGAYADMVIKNENLSVASMVDMIKKSDSEKSDFKSPNAACKKYSQGVKNLLIKKGIKSYEEISEPDLKLLKKQYGVKGYQIKRVVTRFLKNGQSAGRPDTFVNTNVVMKAWLASFIDTNDRNPSFYEIFNKGQEIKAVGFPELAEETAWKCSKGWSKRFLAKNGLRDDDMSSDEISYSN